MSGNSKPEKNNCACENCGKFDAMEIGDKFFCEDCITQAGCACAEREITED